MPEGPFIQISSGSIGTCGIRPDGTVNCWSAYPEVNAAIPPQGVYKAIDGGLPLACGIREDGGIDCWGAEEVHSSVAPAIQCDLMLDGKIECQDSPTRYEDRMVPNPALDVPAGSYKAVASLGAFSACAITTDNRVVCWGQLSGEIGF